MKYGLIGAKLGHSFSPEIHRTLGGYDYALAELSPGELPAFFKARSFDGINVTIPYKEAVIPYLDELDDMAQGIGAVNTVLNRDGRLYGYNTDFFGMKALLSRTGVDPAGKKVLIAGSGGTSRTAAVVARALGAAEVYRVSRSGRDGLLTYEEAKRVHRDADIWINATPCGMFPHAGTSPVDPADYPALSGVIDAVYNPLRTRLVLEAQKRGIPAAGGLCMLIFQAVGAAALFTGNFPPAERVERAERELVAQKRNLVLVGMPGCGKTTLGKLVAEKLGMDFFDGDEVLRKETGLSPADFIRTRGEETFRDAEEIALRKLSEKNHAVIATGGGAVLREENVLNLKGNGKVIFLDRPASALPVTPDRPLSCDRERLAALYEARLPLYRAAAEATVPCVEDMEANVNRIIEEFQS